jgi:hypothetical protein
MISCNSFHELGTSRLYLNAALKTCASLDLFLSNKLDFDKSLTNTNTTSDPSYPSLAGCEIPTPIYNPIKNQASFGDDVMRMVQDTTYNTEEEGMNDFFEKMSLYSVLKQYDTIPEDSILAHFMDIEQYQTIGKFYNAQSELALAFDSSLYGYDTIYNEINDSINKVIKHEHLNNAVNYLSDINTPLQAVQYYQQIAQLQINYLLHDSLTINELESAKSIAALCIYNYGAAVSNARALVSIVEDSTIEWNDNETCFSNFRTSDNDNKEYLEGIAAANEERINKKPESKLLHVNNIIVYPNPANNEINLAYNSIEIGSKFIFYNYLGNEVTVRIISNNSGILNIDATKFGNGLYLYKLLGINGNKISEGKFNILHIK